RWSVNQLFRTELIKPHPKPEMLAGACLMIDGKAVIQDKLPEVDPESAGKSGQAPQIDHGQLPLALVVVSDAQHDALGLPDDKFPTKGQVAEEKIHILAKGAFLPGFRITKNRSVARIERTVISKVPPVEIVQENA